MKHFSHLNSATQLIQQFQGSEPLHQFLKKFFSSHKKFGSKDRKRISHLCYVFYRVGRAFSYEIPLQRSEDIHHVILAGLFLCGNESDELLSTLKPAWDGIIQAGTPEKVQMLNHERSTRQFHPENIFPAPDELSPGIEQSAFSFSHFIQPDLFIRIRPGYQNLVQEKLHNANVEHEILPPSTIRLPNGFRIEDVIDLDREAVVQDLNSQRVGEFLFDFASNGDTHPGQNVKVWDCCAGSGGKSIMAKDFLPKIDLTVSDVRESILLNLNKRFQKAGVTNYKSFTADLSNASLGPTTLSPANDGNFFSGDTKYNFDLIIADVPCSGSGTWGRSPEQLYFFRRETIERYSQLQKNILTNALAHLKESGKLLYVTCSVFRKENEEIINFLQDRFRLKVERMELLKGYDKKADTMFAALLSRL